MGVCKPALRFRGELVPSANASFEPLRTRRLLARPFATWRFANGSDELSSLSTFWLSDVTGGCGCFYIVVKVLAMMATAFLIGFSSGASDFGDAVIGVFGIQLALGCYCILTPHAADRLEGVVSGLEALMSGTSLLLLYLAAGLEATNGQDAGDAGDALDGSSLANASAAARRRMATNASLANETTIAAGLAADASANLAAQLQEWALWIAISGVSLPLLMMSAVARPLEPSGLSLTR